MNGWSEAIRPYMSRMSVCGSEATFNLINKRRRLPKEVGIGLLVNLTEAMEIELRSSALHASVLSTILIPSPPQTHSDPNSTRVTHTIDRHTMTYNETLTSAVTTSILVPGN